MGLRIADWFLGSFKIQSLSHTRMQANAAAAKLLFNR
jgi:hypothetical protein